MRLKISSNYYVTDKQLWYLRRLLNEAFAKRIEHGLCLDPHHLSARMPRTEASAAIGTLINLLNK